MIWGAETTVAVPPLGVPQLGQLFHSFCISLPQDTQKAIIQNYSTPISYEREGALSLISSEWVARREAHCEPMHSAVVIERVLL